MPEINKTITFFGSRIITVWIAIETMPFLVWLLHVVICCWLIHVVFSWSLSNMLKKEDAWDESKQNRNPLIKPLIHSQVNVFPRLLHPLQALMNTHQICIIFHIHINETKYYFLHIKQYFNWSNHELYIYFLLPFLEITFHMNCMFNHELRYSMRY